MQFDLEVSLQHSMIVHFLDAHNLGTEFEPMILPHILNRVGIDFKPASSTHPLPDARLGLRNKIQSLVLILVHSV